MDDIDKRIIFQLDSDCRMTYQKMADKLGITATAVKKRVTKLLERGVIDRFITTLNFEMIDSDLVLAIVQTDGSEFEEDFIDELGEPSFVFQVSPIACGKGGLYAVFAVTSGLSGLSEFGTFIRTLKPVANSEIHVLLYPKGKKVNLTKTQLRVLKYLVENPRMSIVEIADLSGMTARRIRRTIEELQEGEGILFAVIWNLGIGGLTEVLLRIEWDEKNTDHESVIAWLRKRYPLEYWSPFISAAFPVIFARFVVEKLETIESIAREVKRAPFVKSLSTLVFYSNYLFNWPGVTELRRLFETEL
ncbi:MAG: Lrp/AsnC family transcriptional regulator [Candidatus Thorarchaeota archaeon]|nr:Lrp/AsnC family transcriptional regulator [Candidatus Thorarchaeota archaeon]